MASSKQPSGGRKTPLDSQASSLFLPIKRQKVSAKKPCDGQKKPLDEQASFPSTSKNQVSRDFGLLATNERRNPSHFDEQGNDHLFDVTTFSGIDLAEEEDFLVSGFKVKASAASRKCVQSEHKLILEKDPLQEKLTEIITKSGLKNWSNDVEQCLSLCIERRLCNLISSLIKVSKQRVDFDTSRHATIVTSDIREQILAINQKAREELQKKQSEAEKQNELHGSSIVGADKEKDEGSPQPLKMKNRNFGLTKANVAARASLGIDNLLSKWKFMEKIRKNHEDATNKITVTSDENGRKTHKDGKRVHSTVFTTSEVVKQTSENQVAMKPCKLRPISIKDAITVLEREPQMAKSTVLYKLYDRMRAVPAAQ